MRARRAIPILICGLLAGCEVSTTGDTGGNQAGASVSIGGDGKDGVSLKSGDNGVAIDVPGFSAKVKIPGLDIDGAEMDIDGMALAANTTVTRVDVVGDDAAKGGDVVKIGFTSTDAPAKLIAHYREAGKAAGFTMTGDARSASGEKPGGKRFAVTTSPAANGASGEIVVTDPN
ncbi:hypothetical protein ABC347_09975 [Sphingomonas sp. 1P06PA]|uniref:hypothetical protein n=1 Tax=Sphingomonas sp. 1P06PA TaxID=554121 RepID=UPI0039A4AF60